MTPNPTSSPSLSRSMSHKNEQPHRPADGERREDRWLQDDAHTRLGFGGGLSARRAGPVASAGRGLIDV